MLHSAISSSVSYVYQILLSNSLQVFCYDSFQLLSWQRTGLLNVSYNDSTFLRYQTSIFLITKHFRSMDWLRVHVALTAKSTAQKAQSFYCRHEVIKHYYYNRIIKFILKWLNCTILCLLVPLCSWSMILFLRVY